MAVKWPLRWLLGEIAGSSSLDSWLGSMPLGSYLQKYLKGKQKALAVPVVCEMRSFRVPGRPHKGRGLG